MQHWPWVLVGWLGLLCASAVGAKVHMYGLLPSIPLVVVVFVAMHREPIGMLWICLGLGYLLDRSCGAPVGLHEICFVVLGTLLSLFTGSLVGQGRLFYACMCVLASCGEHLLLALLLWWQRGDVAIPSTLHASLLPAGCWTGCWGWLLYPWWQRLERRLTPVHRGDLLWR